MEHEQIPTLQIDGTVAEYQIRRLKAVRKSRDSKRVRDILTVLKKAASDEMNLMPFLVDCVKCYATLGEIVETLKDIYGEYQEPIMF
jgi:methylmalonyl-CoA mutase N-terminal domain/subunit